MVCFYFSKLQTLSSMSMKYPQMVRPFLVVFEIDRIPVNGVHMLYVHLP